MSSQARQSEQALIREAKEEVGLIPLRFMAAGSILKPEPGSNDEAAYHFFTCLNGAAANR